MKNLAKSFIHILFFFLISVTISAQDKNYTILISFDGFRWDYPNRGITPTFKMIAENGVSALSLQPSFPSK
ncbi:MAG: alkaline phosphatase family protein, partial [Ignavibacteriaceae bacterium]|nr:alkaline phosphatase family protein [Ignavibacteriaceae bacterium]